MFATFTADLSRQNRTQEVLQGAISGGSVTQCLLVSSNMPHRGSQPKVRSLGMFEPGYKGDRLARAGCPADATPETPSRIDVDLRSGFGIIRTNCGAGHLTAGGSRLSLMSVPLLVCREAGSAVQRRSRPVAWQREVWQAVPRLGLGERRPDRRLATGLAATKTRRPSPHASPSRLPGHLAPG